MRGESRILFSMPSKPQTSENESFSPSLIGAKGSEAQGRCREAPSGRSVEQNRGSMNKNRLLRRQGWTSGLMAAKSEPIKTRKRKVGDRARKGMWDIWGDLSGALAQAGAERAARRADRCPEVSRGHSSDEGRETGWSEGPNGAPEWAQARSGQVN